MTYGTQSDRNTHVTHSKKLMTLNNKILRI